MVQASLVMFEDESKELCEIIGKLLKEANAKSIYLVDKDGQLIAASGETQNIDATSLASLTAGNIAATGGLAQLTGGKEFSILFHQGEKDNLHISIVAQRVILVVIFDSRSSLGLVRLRVKKASDELNAILQKLLQRVEKKPSDQENLLAEITDSDIDKLFH